MNKVYLSEWDIFPLSNEALAAIASGGDSKFYKQLLPLYPDRITGNLCNCNGNGEFILLSHEKGSKYYMYYKKCGITSHL